MSVEDLHAATAAALTSMLDTDAGLREILIEAAHRATAGHLHTALDVEAGLDEVLLPESTEAAGTPSTDPATRDDGCATVVRVLRSTDVDMWMAVRNHGFFVAAAEALRTSGDLGEVMALMNSLAETAHALIRLTEYLERFPSGAGARTYDQDQIKPLINRLDNAAQNLDDVIGIALNTRGTGASPSRGRSGLVDVGAEFLQHFHDLWQDLTGTRPHCRSGIQHAEALWRLVAHSLPGALEPLAATLTDRMVDHRRQIAVQLGSVPVESLHPHLENALRDDLGRAATVACAARLISSLDARHDFTAADLRQADLHDVSLEGVRWSVWTIWPSADWREYVAANSVEVGPGVFEVREGTKRLRPVRVP